MLPMQPFSGKLRCPCVRGSHPSQSARRTGQTSSLVVTVDQRQVHRPSRRPIKIKIPALCLRRTRTQGRGTLHPKLMQAEKAKPTQVVVEPDKAAETPLGMTPWSATGQGHDCDEAAGGEAEDSTVPPASPEEVYSVGGSAGPFSESARRGAPRAPRVISVHVRDKPGLWFPVKVAGPVSSPDPTRRQLQNRIPYQLQPHSPILKRAGLVAAVTAHIQGEIETVLNGTALAEVTAPHAQLCDRGNLWCSPQ